LKRIPLFVPVLAVLATLVLIAPASAQEGANDELTRLERAVARDSSKVDNLYRLGVLYLDHDRALDATRVLTRAVVADPRNVKALVNLGVAWDASGKPRVAQQYYEKALEISPKDPVAKCRLASSIYAQSQYERAVDLLREIVRESPDAHCGYFTLGVAFADAGIYRDAIRMWKKVVELAPESQEAISARESIEVLEKFVLKQ
jgi:cytochrome c-type biogenesis protein CcmH/NrfG